MAEDKKKKEKNVEKALKKTEKKGVEVKPKKAPLTMTTKVTKRPFNKVMEKVRLKIREKLQLRLAGLPGAKQDLGDVIMGALDDTKVKGKLNFMLKQKQIMLVDSETGQQKYKDAIQKAVEAPAEAFEEEDDMCSPERKTKTRIEMKESHLQELEHEVKGAIERQRTGKVGSAEKKPA